MPAARSRRRAQAVVAQQTGRCHTGGRLVALDEQRLDFFEGAVFGLGHSCVDPEDGEHTPAAVLRRGG